MKIINTIEDIPTEILHAIFLGDWRDIARDLKVSETFIERHADKLNWFYISEYQKLSEAFIERHADKVYWTYISRYQKLSEAFIEKHTDKVNWDCISMYQKLSEAFIEKHADKVYWDWISMFQKLSESFIERHKGKFRWSYILQYQKLSESFIEKHNSNNKVLYWIRISKFQKLSSKFRKKYNLTIPKDNWLYASNEEKEKAVLAAGYEVLKGEVIAYKGVRENGYSRFNFQYHYEVGKIYESHCDCNLDVENSFGLSAWTLEEAKNYCDEKVFEVSIKLKDLGALVHNGGKLRAFKMRIVSEI